MRNLVHAFLRSSVILASLLLHFGQLGAVAQEDRLRLRVVGDLPLSPSDIKVLGHYAYVAASDIEIFDVSDPANPTRVGTYRTVGPVLSIELREHFAFLTERDSLGGSTSFGMLEILDVSDPALPLLVGAVSTSAPADRTEATGLQISADYGYLPAGSRGTGSNAVGVLEIFDLRDLSNPLRVGTYESGRYINSIQVDGRYAYLTDDEVDLQVLDLSNPVDPQWVTSFKTNHPNIYGAAGPAWGLKLISPNYLCVLDGLDVTYLIDVTDPAEPTFTILWPAGGPVYFAGKYAFAFSIFFKANGTPDFRLRTLDVSQPTAPVVVLRPAPLQDSWQGLPLAIIGNYAYVRSGAGLLVVEITELPYIDSVSRNGDQLVLKWRGAPGMKLQRTDLLIIHDWTDVLGSEGQSEVELPLGSGPEFFRLVSP